MVNVISEFFFFFFWHVFQALHHCVPTHSSQLSHGSRPTCPPTCRSRLLRAQSTRTCLWFPRSFRGAPNPHPARRHTASAASRRRSAARRAWKSPDAAALFSPSCSWWAWRRSSRSRSTSPHLTGQKSSDNHNLNTPRMFLPHKKGKKKNRAKKNRRPQSNDMLNMFCSYWINLMFRLPSSYQCHSTCSTVYDFQRAHWKCAACTHTQRSQMQVVNRTSWLPLHSVSEKRRTSKTRALSHSLPITPH